MPEKLDNLEFDILSVLKKHEPKMLRWSEIVGALWSNYKFKYKDEKGFGVAVTNKLKLLVAGGKARQEGIFYGTPLSTASARRSSSFIDQSCELVKGKFWAERTEIFKLRESVLSFGKENAGDIFNSWEKTERFVELIPDLEIKKPLQKSLADINHDLYEPRPGGYWYDFSRPVVEQQLEWLYPKAMMLYDVIPRVWAEIYKVVQNL
jgi:hypothetical protein